MTAFADSSALVKRYADEPGAPDVRALGFLVVSVLARVEVPAALWRKNRMGALSAEQVGLLVAGFASDVADAGIMLTVSARRSVLTDAARLVATHGLRAHDAVQLASARAARAADTHIDEFACYDTSLRRAAVAEGFLLAV